MKKMLLLIIVSISMLLFHGCTENEKMNWSSSKITITLPQGEKLVKATRHRNLVYLTEPMEEGYIPQKKDFVCDHRHHKEYNIFYRTKIIIHMEGKKQFSVMVIGEKPETKLEAFNPETEIEFQLKSFELGGKWNGSYIRLKPGSNNSYMAGTKINQAYLKDIDFDAIRNNAREQAAKDYQKTIKQCHGKPKIIESHDRFFYFPNNPIPQRFMVDILDNKTMIITKVTDEQSLKPQIKDFQCSEEEYISKAVESSFSPSAILKDGNCYVQDSLEGNPIKPGHWNKQVWDIIQSLPDNALISFYDCCYWCRKIEQNNDLKTNNKSTIRPDICKDKTKEESREKRSVTGVRCDRNLAAFPKKRKHGPHM